MNVLDRILFRTREDLAQRKADLPLAELRRRAVPTRRKLSTALSAPGLSLIAEFKPASPSRGALRPDADPRVYAKAYGRVASAISVLCDTPFFGGGRHLLKAFRHLELPLLCKDFIVGEYQIVEARAAGADAVLLMASVLDRAALTELLAVAHELGMDALVEVHDEAELERVLATPARVVGINSRDLKTLQIDLTTVPRLAARVPADRIRVAESGVSSRADVDAFRGVVDAVLVGSTLMAAADPVARLQELGWTA
ncbi:MAG: indole-3-glycerol phosphate synthase TrpC [Myxococcota bacterium]